MSAEAKATLIVTSHGNAVTVSDGKHAVQTICESPSVAKKLVKRLLANPAMADTWVRITEPMKHGPYDITPIKPAG